MLRPAGDATTNADTDTDADAADHADEVVELHGAMGKAVWDSLGSDGGLSGSSPADAEARRQSHNTAQAAAFDSSADFFASDDATPPEVVPRLQRIAQTAADAVVAAGPLEESGEPVGDKTQTGNSCAAILHGIGGRPGTSLVLGQGGAEVGVRVGG